MTEIKQGFNSFDLFLILSLLFQFVLKGGDWEKGIFKGKLVFTEIIQ